MSLRPNYFIFIGYLKQGAIRWGSKEPPEPPLDPPLYKGVTIQFPFSFCWCLMGSFFSVDHTLTSPPRNLSNVSFKAVNSKKLSCLIIKSTSNKHCQFIVITVRCNNLLIYHEGEMEKSVPRITDWHHKACQVMTNGDREGQIFLSHPYTKNGFFNLLTTKYLILYCKNMKKTSRKS